MEFSACVSIGFNSSHYKKSNDATEYYPNNYRRNEEVRGAASYKHHITPLTLASTRTNS